MYFVVSSDKATYAEDSTKAALEAGAPEWDCAALATAIRHLDMGDELAVGSDVSVFRISGKEINFAGQI